MLELELVTKWVMRRNNAPYHSKGRRPDPSERPHGSIICWTRVPFETERNQSAPLVSKNS